MACCSQDCQWQLCADKAHGGAVALGPLVRKAGCQTSQEVLSFSLYYTISGDDERREVSAALPTCLRMLRLLRLCKAIQNSSDGAIGIHVRLGVSVANSQSRQRTPQSVGAKHPAPPDHILGHTGRAHLQLCWPRELRAQTWRVKKPLRCQNEINQNGHPVALLCTTLWKKSRAFKCCSAAHIWYRACKWWRQKPSTRGNSSKLDIREVLQHVILAKKPYKRRLQGAAPILYVILVRKPRNERPRYGLST